jgi:adenylate kinase
MCDVCGGEVYQRDDDTVETVSNRLDVYERSTAPLVDYYERTGLLRNVDGNQDPDAVFADVQAALGG